MDAGGGGAENPKWIWTEDKKVKINGTEILFSSGFVAPKKDPKEWNGFYYRNDYADGAPGPERKIAWSFYDEGDAAFQEKTLANLEGAYALLETRKHKLPYFILKTKTEDDGSDVSEEYRSKENYEAATSEEKEWQLVHFGSEPAFYEKVNRTALVLNDAKSEYGTGSRVEEEKILSLSIETDEDLAEKDKYEFSVREFGFCLSGVWYRYIPQFKSDFTNENNKKMLLMEQIERDLIEVTGSGLTDEERELLTTVSEDLEKMKGPGWDDRFSITGNYKDILIEKITPKNIQVNVESGIAKVSFSYEDHPELSHFVLEYFDESSGTWKPYDGADGIVTKS
jgi:hypothetical protein